MTTVTQPLTASQIAALRAGHPVSFPITPPSAARFDVTLEPVAAPPPPPPPTGPPILPTGTITENGSTFSQLKRWQGFAAGLPSGVSEYQKDPGPGTNQFWPGNLTTIDPATGDIVLTSDWQAGRVANAGVGFWGMFTAPGAVDIVAKWDGTYRNNLTRYFLTWTKDGQERDHLEGVPARFSSHNHQWPGNQNTQDGPSWDDELDVWICYRILVLPEGTQTYSGPSFAELSVRSTCAYAGGSMSTFAADLDLAQEAEGPMSASDFATPCVDRIAAVAIYKEG